jgi:hypothetical protein
MEVFEWHRNKQRRGTTDKNERKIRKGKEQKEPHAVLL